MNSSHPTQRLPIREKVSYGIGDIANGLAVSSVAFWLLYYLTDVAGLPGTLAGAALMIGRAWDAIIDPFVGWVSDRTESRWGKRRPFLLFGAWAYGLAYLSLWTVPNFSHETYTFLYVAISFVFFNTALAFVFIPYTSLTAVMTSDYNERTSLTGYRMTCSQLSFIIGGALPPLVVSWIISPAGQEFLGSFGINSLFGPWAGSARQAYALIAAAIAICMIGSVLIAFAGTKERASPDEYSHQSINPFSYIKALIRISRDNVAFRTSVLIKLLSTCATTLIGVNIPYYLTYVLGMESQKSWILGCLFASAILFTPVWVLIAKRKGKAEAYRLATAGYIGVLLLLLPLPSEPTKLIYPIALLAGICHSAALMIPWSIIPDVVEYDELKSGSRREGLLYGGSAFAYKFASALALFLVGLLLDAFGYVPNQHQTLTAIWGIKLTIALAPGILFLLSIWCSLSYPLSSARYAEVLAELDAKRSASKKISD